MASFGTFKINEELDADVVLYWDCRYVLADNTLLPTRQTEAWCRNCRKLVAAEYIPTVAEIDEEIRQLSDPSDKIHKCFGRQTIEKMLLENRRRLDWLRTRKSPAHCLDCQKTDVLPIDSDDVFDEVSGTRIRRVSSGHASMVHEVRRRLTPEGNLIKTEAGSFGYGE